MSFSSRTVNMLYDQGAHDKNNNKFPHLTLMNEKNYCNEVKG